MKQQAFTLIETLVAASLAVIVLGAGVISSRTVESNTTFSSDSVQMNALADESITSFKLWRDQLQEKGLTLSDASALDIKESDANNTKQRLGYFFSYPTALNGCAPVGLACKDQTEGGPVLLQWCDTTKNKSNCMFNTSPVGIDDIQNLKCPANGNKCEYDVLFSKLGGDLVAIGRAGDVGDQGYKRIIVDGQTNPSTPLGSLKTEVLTSERAKWDFYFRTLTITRQDNTQAMISGPDFKLGATNMDAAANNAMRKASYLVNVTITSYANPKSTITKSALLTDWK